MAKYRAGLHKEITAIFDGVPLPKNKAGQQKPDTPLANYRGYAPPEPPAPVAQADQVPKRQQPTEAREKPEPVKQPKAADTVRKTTRQIPWQQSWERVWGQIKNKLFAPKPGVNTTRQITMVILVPLLFIVLIFAFTKTMKGPSRKTPNPVISGTSETIAGSRNDEIDWEIPEIYPTTLRDPMRVISATAVQQDAGQASELIIKGIVYSEDDSSVVIGSQIVSEGEKISGVTVVRINKDSVEFEMNGKRWTQKVQR